jgi:hypothetical protein
MKLKGTETSIIEIIEKMVKEGRPQEEILKELKSLGIKEEQARKLLLLGEADTFALLKNEIKKMVKEDMKKEEEVFRKLIVEIVKEEEQKVEDSLSRQIKELGARIEGKIKEEEKSEKKKEKMKELMKLLSKPETTHGIKFDFESEALRKEKHKKGLKEVKL